MNVNYEEKIKKVSDDDYIFSCIGTTNNCQLTESQINFNSKDKILTISSWYTLQEFQHQGLGTKNLKQNLNNVLYLFGKPKEIKYIWNGANKYVLDWLKTNFDATNNENISVLKNGSKDNWNNHIYNLNIEKFMKYFSRIIP